MLDILKNSIGFILMTVLLWIASLMIIVCGTCMVVFSPIVALWFILDGRDSIDEIVETVEIKDGK